MQNSVDWYYLLNKTSQFLTLPSSRPGLLYTHNSIFLSTQQEVVMQTLIQLWVCRCIFHELNFFPSTLAFKTLCYAHDYPFNYCFSHLCPGRCCLATLQLVTSFLLLYLQQCLFSSYPCLPSHSSVGRSQWNPMLFSYRNQIIKNYILRKIPAFSTACTGMR